MASDKCCWNDISWSWWVIMKSKSHYHCELTEWECGATGKFEEQHSRALDLDFAEIKARQKGSLMQSSLGGRERHHRQSFKRLSCSYAFTGKRAHINWCLWFSEQGSSGNSAVDRVPLEWTYTNVFSCLVTGKETSGHFYHRGNNFCRFIWIFFSLNFSHH